MGGGRLTRRCQGEAATLAGPSGAKYSAQQRARPRPPPIHRSLSARKAPMAKAKTRYVCQDCGHDAPRWTGQCAGCGAWNTLVEEAAPTAVKAPVMRANGGGRLAGAYGSARPQRLRDVAVGERPRLATGLKALDHVMDGGIMLGSLTLDAGEPGIGRSKLST